MLALMLMGMAVHAETTYLFCIKSDSFDTFKAQVTFRTVDFGENAARQMVINRVKPHLDGDFEISVYKESTCVCEAECPVLEVTAQDWDGNMSDAKANTIMGSAAESLDMIFYNAKEIFNNPGGFLKKAFFGSKDGKEG